MLKDNQLQILRAAMVYFEEELSPLGQAAYRNYLPDRTPTVQEVQHCQQLLDPLRILELAKLLRFTARCFTRQALAT